VEPGGSIAETAKGEVSSARPGSGAGQRHGTDRQGTCEDPARVHGRDEPERGTPADQLFQAGGDLSVRRSASASTNERGARGSRDRTIRERECVAEVVAPSYYLESGEPSSSGPVGGKGAS